MLPLLSVQFSSVAQSCPTLCDPMNCFSRIQKVQGLHCWWECKLVQPLWRTECRFLKKLEVELSYDPAIPLLGVHTEETRIEGETYTPMFIAALFTIERTWKQPKKWFYFFSFLILWSTQCYSSPLEKREYTACLFIPPCRSGQLIIRLFYFPVRL